jgi:hypothetical protein
MDGTEFMGLLIPLSGIFFAFTSPVALVALILAYKHRKLRMKHETLLKLAEKGVPIPPELLSESGPRPNSDLRRGIILVAVGLGLSIFMAQVGNGAPWAIGLIPAFAGLGYLITWKLEQQDAGTASQKAAQTL